MTFEQMPDAVERLITMVGELQTEIRHLRANQPINESPIDGIELRKRLGISRPTEIAMRNKGKLPYLMVNGNYRYNWQDVQKALSAQS